MRTWSQSSVPARSRVERWVRIGALAVALAVGLASGLALGRTTEAGSTLEAAAVWMPPVATPPATERGAESPTPAPSQLPAPQATDVFGSIPSIVERVQPAVVSVRVRTRGDEGAEGSGVIFDGARGLVVTNNHVVDGARSVQVELASSARVRARVLAANPRVDLAVLALARTGLPEAHLAGSLPRLGELAVALGNPLGFENSVTAGIVSGLHRSLLPAGRDSALTDLVQTDAPISPGNSGGALVSRDGEVIGINVAAIPPTPQTRASSIGFAIPSTRVTSVIEGLLGSDLQ